MSAEKKNFMKIFNIDPDAGLDGLSNEALQMRKDLLYTSAKRLLDEAEKQQRNLTDDENRAYGTAMKLLDEVERKQKGEGFELTAWGDPRSARSSILPEKRSWSDILYTGRSHPQGTPDLNQFLTDIVERRTMATISGPSGGYLIPAPISPEIVNSVSEQSIWMNLVQKVAATGKTQSIVSWDSEDRTAGPLGAFSASWQAEGAAATPVTPQLRVNTIPIQKLSVYVDASREVAQDGINFAQQLGRAMIQAVAYGIDSALISGNGVGCPYGVLSSDSAVKISRNTASSIKTADVFSMYSRIWPALLQDAIWLCSPAAIPQILSLQDPGNNYIFMPATDGLSKAVPGFLLGKALYVTESCSNLGTEGDLILCAPSAYVLCMRQEIEIEQTVAAKWSQDLVSFRVVCRLGGQPLMDTAITPKTGGSTLSWAAILQ